MRFPRSSGILLHPTSLAVAVWHRRLGGRSPAVCRISGGGRAEAVASAAAWADGFRRLALSVLFGVGRQSAADQLGAPGGAGLAGCVRARDRARVSRRPGRFRAADPVEDRVAGIGQTHPATGFEDVLRGEPALAGRFRAVRGVEGSSIRWRRLDAMGTRRARSRSASAWRNGVSSWPRRSPRKNSCSSLFFEQWRELREYARARGVRIMGDLPIYVSHDSADVWANRQYFQSGRARQSHGGLRCAARLFQPDRPALGQSDLSLGCCWRRTDTAGGWIDFARRLTMVDMIRLDHFRGFEAYWEVPASEPTAVNGTWVKGPGAALFRAAQERS